MKHNFTTLLTVIALIFQFSCSKNNEDAGTKSKSDLITNGSWKLVSWIANPPEDFDGDGIPESDFLAKLESCEKDDTHTFKTNGDLVLDYKVQCDYDDGLQTETIKWDFTNNETTLRMKYDDGDMDSYQIIELTATTLKIRDTYTDDGVTYIDELTFTH